MKITAEFDSVDTADIVAASLRHQIAGMADIKVLGPELTEHGTERVFQGFAPAYSNTVGGASFGMSVGNSSDSRFGTAPDSFSKAVRVQLICRKDDAQLAKRIMIGYGGRDLRGS
ncbi:MAG: hypothetical protein LBL98_03355 [Ruminococcus sp.]|jgi:hypothetical protein|nr:hypothetical protein [Ruminococcus sp.]